MQHFMVKSVSYRLGDGEQDTCRESAFIESLMNDGQRWVGEEQVDIFVILVLIKVI